jgi:RHS repeat-associated protein
MTGYALGTSVTTTYVLDLMENARPLSATSNGNTTYYVYGLGPVAELTTEWSYSLTDGTNTPRQLTNGNGEITLAGRYTPWGDSLDYTGTGNFTFGYFGGLMDSATGLLYVGNGQYYDPETGRFLTRQAQPDKTNPYVPWNPIGAVVGPLGVVALLFGRRKKGSKAGTFLVLLLVLGSVGMTLAACGPTPSPIPPSPIPPTIPPSTPSPEPSPSPTQTGKTAYLTFDDGPDPSVTPQIALYLQQRGARATFFVSGTSSGGFPRISLPCIPNLNGPDLVSLQGLENTPVISLLYNSGHAIGIHGWNHDIDWNLQADDGKNEVDLVREALEQALPGANLPKLLRAPRGNFPQNPISGYENWYYYEWTIAPEEGAQTADGIIQNLKQELEAKGRPDNPVILLHSIRLDTLNAVVNSQYDMLTVLQEMGYTRFESLPRPQDNPGYPVIEKD